MEPFILASRSPRRRELLQQAGYHFEVYPAPEAVESDFLPDPETTPLETVAQLAWQKARAVHLIYPTRLVLGCDTLADLDGECIGKPRDKAHAREILQQLSGRDHLVHSGLCLWPPEPGVPRVATASSQVRVNPLSDHEIEQYLETGLWEGKAGAFGYQDRQGWVALIAGTESNVVGLPMELLAQMLGALTQSGPA